VGGGGNVDHSGGFTTTDDLTANGSAQFVVNAARLTNGQFGEAGSIFSNEAVDITNFTNTFTFQLLPGTFPLADGITFTLQGNGPTELGPSGGGLGYGPDFPSGFRGIRNSVAVKFDVYDNAGEGINSTGLFTDGRSPTVPESGSGDILVNLDGTGIDLNSQHPFRVDMVYDGAVLDVTITDTMTLATAGQSYVVDIVSQVGGATAFVGFTGGTGGLSAIQEVLDWTFDSSQTNSDVYQVEVGAGQTIDIETATPADGPDEFGNLLDPLIRLYDAAGNLVASDDNSATDGRNAKLSYTIPAGAEGTYFVEIGPSDLTGRPTQGEYVLTVKVGTLAPIALPSRAASASAKLPGDVNDDGIFDSADLVKLFQVGEYKDSLADNSSWQEGDWNGDRDFTTADLVLAFASGYVHGDAPPTSGVVSRLTPEPEWAKMPRGQEPSGADSRLLEPQLVDSLFRDRGVLDHWGNDNDLL
jgi:hypothetical protein